MTITTTSIPTIISSYGVPYLEVLATKEVGFLDAATKLTVKQISTLDAIAEGK